MAENPLNSERVIRTESQVLLWLGGISLHNGQHSGHGECTPDFSCCNPDLLSTTNERIFKTLEILKQRLMEAMRRSEPDYDEEVDLVQQEFFVRVVERWFDDLAFDTA